MRRLARSLFSHPWRVLAVAAVLVGGLVAANRTVGGAFADDFGLPGSESQEAQDLLAERGFGARSGFGGQVVFTAEDVTAPSVRQPMTELFDRIGAAIGDGELVTPYAGDAAGQISPDSTVAYAEINLPDLSTSRVDAIASDIEDIVAAAEVPGTRIELGGDVFADPPAFSSEVVGFAAAIVILLVAFGSVLAMGLPLVTAVAGILAGIAAVGLVSNVVGMPTFSNQAVAMIGIGVGIDYALLVVTRYREGLHADLEPREAAEVALDTAGRSVLFAGGTVVIAVLGLLTIGLSLVRGLAIGISIGVLATLLAALTVLPAALGVVRGNIDRLGLPHRRRGAAAGRDSWGHRWSRVIQRHPWPAVAVATTVLLVLAIPVTSIRLGFGDAGNRPTSDTTRRAYDLVSEGFGPGFNGPLLLAVALPPGDTDPRPFLDELRSSVESTDGVGFVSPPQVNDAGTAAVVQVIPRTSPQAVETERLVERLRTDVIPDVVQGTGGEVHVGGLTAVALDFSDYTASRLPWFIAAVLALSFVLLMVVFRSLLVPLKAVVMNLLGVGAAYGVLVAVFQWGWGLSLIGVGKEGPVAAWVPMMLFAIVFGLSMDYEVFLLSRMKEMYDASGDNASAVADGLAATARVITAAAAIMFFVFASFVLGSERSLKLFGLGLAVAVLLDATLVRLVLVPATMELLGRWNWWLPRWLDRALPRVTVEPESELSPGGRRAGGRDTAGGGPGGGGPGGGGPGGGGHERRQAGRPQPT